MSGLLVLEQVQVCNRDSKLKTSLSHVELLMKNYQLHLLMIRHAPIQFYSTVTTTLPSKWFDIINLTSYKAEAYQSSNELISCALETIKQR
ncbi:hypothetical protein TNCV_3254431 [Trichonephila clavipes]|nr:hypothetical protein TNCV_3254431 [Trichonephila clavipes]